MQLLVDVSILYHRCYHAMDHLTTDKGVHTGMEYGTLMALRKYNAQYDSMILCFDPPRSSFEREKRVDGYKANRSVKPKEFYSRVDELTATLKCKYSWSEHNGIEADRLLYTLADLQTKPTPRVPRFVLTNDYDLMQVIQKGVCVIRSGHGKDRLWGEEELWEKFKVRPSYWAMFRALTGDPSDNLAGCKGIGKSWGGQFVREAVRRREANGGGDLHHLREVVETANLTQRQRENWDNFKQNSLRVNYDLIRLTPYTPIKVHQPTGASIQEYLDKLQITSMAEETEF